MKPITQFELLSGAGKAVQLRWFGRVDYADSYQAMKTFADTRGPDSADELWLLEHPSVYTQGTACDLGTFINTDIPIVKTDRGGQITYHGPGQIVMYVLLHLKNHNLGVKALVNKLEQCVIDVLAAYGLQSSRREDAPGVYIDEAKIAALGLRIRRGNSYHGLSLNIDMDMSPFSNIDPCGYQGLKVTQLSEKMHQQLNERVKHQAGVEESDLELSGLELIDAKPQYDSLAIGRQLAQKFVESI